MKNAAYEAAPITVTVLSVSARSGRPLSLRMVCEIAETTIVAPKPANEIVMMNHSPVMFLGPFYVRIFRMILNFIDYFQKIP